MSGIKKKWRLVGSAEGIMGGTPKIELETDIGSFVSPVFDGSIVLDHVKPLVSVVIPALNEADNLRFVLPRIPRWVHEVLLVDGHSTDGTPEVARLLLPDVKLLKQERPGKGAALQVGFAAAEGDVIVMMDADGSMDPAEIPLFVGALLAGADFVKGSRFLQGGGTADMEWYRQAGNSALRMLVRLSFGGRFSDLCYGYAAFWRRLLPVLDIDADGFEVETMMNVRALAARMRIAEVPSFESPRICGESHLRTIPDGWRVLRTILTERRYATRVEENTTSGAPPLYHRVGSGPRRGARHATAANQDVPT